MIQDPAMLLSFVNMKLRDSYADLTDLCEAQDMNEEELLEKLKKFGYHYDKGQNAFISDGKLFLKNK